MLSLFWDKLIYLDNHIKIFRERGWITFVLPPYTAVERFFNVTSSRSKWNGTLYPMSYHTDIAKLFIGLSIECPIDGYGNLALMEEYPYPFFLGFPIYKFILGVVTVRVVDGKSS